MHRFSNREEVRQQLREAAKYRSWQEIPDEVRWLILEEIQSVVRQVLEAE